MNIFDRVGPENFKCIVHCEAPHKDLYSFNGMIESDQFQESQLLNPEISTNNTHRAYPLDNNQIVLRGSILANTDWIVGVAIYTGKETKIVLN